MLQNFFLLIILIIFLNFSFILTKEKNYFYIYNWPYELEDVYPSITSIIDNKSSYTHDFNYNHGAGKLLEEDIGMFSTWQFSLFKNIMSRLKVSEYRTLDPLKASSFIIPYDAGVHSYIDHKTGKIRLASPYGWKAIELLKKASKTHTWHNRGHDHFVFFSLTGYHYVGIGTKNFFTHICQNCTVITIETTPGNMAIAGRTHKYWYAVPYPSSFHWYEGIKERPWLTTNSNQRNILSIFIGSVKTATPSSNLLRRSLYNECSQHNQNECQWHLTAHSCSGIINQTNTMLLYRKSKFCLAPPGDSLTRKSLFDSYLSGCIPVIFARASLTQYGWHLSEQDINQTTVYIPKLDIIQGKASFLNKLKAISEDEIKLKQEAIARIAPRLQYSVVPSQWSTYQEGLYWSPPEKDATDIIIEKILDIKTIEPLTGFTPKQVKEMQREQNHIMTTDPDYMGMGIK